MQNRVWLLFAILFLASFDMHAQLPFLSPYIASMGATSVMIGILLGAYSMSNLAGNLVAGPLLDRYSKKRWISAGLIAAGCLLAGHAYATTPQALFVLRLLLGFTMAFVTPACYALLGAIGKTEEEKGRVMAKNGMVITIASIVSPGIGGFLAAHVGYIGSFYTLGGVMLLAGLIAVMLLPQENRYEKRLRRHDSKLQGERSRVEPPRRRSPRPVEPSWLGTRVSPATIPVFASSFAITYAQGTIMYEIPLLIHRQGLPPTVTGLLFSLMGVGSLAVLSQLWINRLSTTWRSFIGLVGLGLVLYALAVESPLTLHLTMCLFGAGLGLLFPAMTTKLMQHSSTESYGSAFSLYSAVLSVGAIAGPLAAGALASSSDSFFLSFLVMFLAAISHLVWFGEQNGKTAPLIR
ncbi:MFS transporter [Brevibacillus humidisoli]|uniref:MFS transporter n=1 Tax=Brevibacillus humidisoli TaxID=2895522 RepID=UPI001E4DC295|nr:MFS transporter [Brevibacillus humidisoli]UFJ43002.1 MFS transporter [Brevibacillus humidisoli]